MDIYLALLLLLPMMSYAERPTTENPIGFEEVRVSHAYFKSPKHLEDVLGIKFPKSANGNGSASESATTLDQNHILSEILSEPNTTTITHIDPSPSSLTDSSNASLLAKKEKTTTESTEASNSTGKFEVELENDPTTASPIASDKFTLITSVPSESPLSNSESVNDTQAIEQTETENEILTASNNFTQASESSSSSSNLSSSHSEPTIPTSQNSRSPSPTASDDNSVNPSTIISESATSTASSVSKTANPSTITSESVNSTASTSSGSADPSSFDSSPIILPSTPVFHASPFATDSSIIQPHRKSKCLEPIRLGQKTATTTTIRTPTQPKLYFSGINRPNITYRPKHTVQFWCKRGTYCPVELNVKTTKIGYKMKSFMLHALDRSEGFLSHTSRNTLTGVPMYTGRNSYQVEFRGMVTNVTVLVLEASAHNHLYQLVLCRPQMDPFFVIPNTRTVFLAKLANAVGVRVKDLTIVSISSKFGGFTVIEFFLNKLAVEKCEEEKISSVIRRMEEEAFWVGMFPDFSVHSVMLQTSGACNQSASLLSSIEPQKSDTGSNFWIPVLGFLVSLVGVVAYTVYICGTHIPRERREQGWRVRRRRSSLVMPNLAEEEMYQLVARRS